MDLTLDYLLFFLKFRNMCFDFQMHNSFLKTRWPTQMTKLRIQVVLSSGTDMEQCELIAVKSIKWQFLLTVASGNSL